MGNRKQPFGYQMTLGEIMIPEEAEAGLSVYLPPATAREQRWGS